MGAAITMTTEPAVSGGSKVRPAVAAVGLCLGLLVYLMLPASLGEPTRRTLGVVATAAVLWATECVPLFATSLAVVIALILLLTGAPQPSGANIRPEAFLDPFGSSTVLMFLGGFIISAAMVKHHLHQVLALALIKPFASRPTTLVLGVLCVTSLISMWLGITATATMMLAVISPLLATIPRGAPLERALVLAVPFGAAMGGIATPVGTPPNAIAMQALRDAGSPISFLGWMLMAMPLSLLLIAGTGVILLLHFPPGRQKLDVSALVAPQKLSRHGWITAGVTGMTILLWLTQSLHGWDPAVIALLAAACLAVTGALTRTDLNRLDWDVLVLMWGGMALSKAMLLSGILEHIKHLPLGQFSGVALAACVYVLTMLLSELMSNTATANLVVPLTLALAPEHRPQMIVLAAIACSTSMSLPVSTPANAMAFATGRISSWDMLRTGASVSVLAVTLVLLGYQLVLPRVLGGQP